MGEDRQSGATSGSAKSRASALVETGLAVSRTSTFRDTGLICTNGHVVNSSVQQRPQYNADFCSDCGAPTIRACDICDAAIPGGLYTVRVHITREYGYSYVGGL